MRIVLFLFLLISAKPAMAQWTPQSKEDPFAARADGNTEIRCRQVLLNYAAIADTDKALPALFSPDIKFKPDSHFEENFETEEIETSNGASVNMTCHRDGTLEGFDIGFTRSVSLAPAKHFFSAILASMRSLESAKRLVEMAVDRAAKDANEASAEDFGNGTTIIFHLRDRSRPTMIIDRTQPDMESPR